MPLRKVVLAEPDGDLVELRASVFYTESTTPLAGAATLTGTARDVGVDAGSPTSRSYFRGYVYTNQIGTFSIESSNNGTDWFPVASSAVAVSTPLTLTVPVGMRYNRVKLVNGATLQGSLVVTSGYVS